MTWQPAPFGDLYDISRGLLSQLAGDDYGACQNHRDADRSDTRFEDAETSPPADGFFYLVRALNLVCPASGPWGHHSDGTARANTNPDACP